MPQKQVTVLVGSGAIGVAIARRVSVGRELVLADLKPENAERQAEELRNAGYSVHTVACDVSNREAIRNVVDFAAKLGESPASSTPPACRPRRHPPHCCSRWICTARRFCWKSSARSSRAAAAR
ncbi:SDR family NAD(P)-dependent oxidoreductase [Eikenella glucosivorans]|uniref:SDR family NAD(P)-dependent oxidoreductase n=1 Tax=Eikenella glucosivorans TaxID=2766967 RepID=UPI0018D82783